MNQTGPDVCIHSDYGNPYKVDAVREIPDNRSFHLFSTMEEMLEMMESTKFGVYICETGYLILIRKAQECRD